MKKVFISIGKVIFVQGYSNGLNLITRMVMARILTVGDFGLYSLLFNWVQVLSRLNLGGVNSLIVKELGTIDWTYGGVEKVPSVIYWCSRLFAFISFASVFIFVGIRFFPGLSDWNYWIIIPYIFLFSFFYAFYEFQKSIFQGFGLITSSRIGQFMLLPTFILIACLVLNYFHDKKIAFDQFMFVLIIAHSLTLISIIFLVSRQIILKLNLVLKWPKLNVSPEWRRYTRHSVYSSLVFHLMNRVDILMIGAMLDTEAVAIYSIPSMLIQALSFGAYAMFMVLEPKMSFFYHRRKLTRLLPFLRLNTLIAILMMSIVAVLIIKFGDYILLLFGKDFTDGFLIFQILAPALIAKVMAGPVTMLLDMTGEVKAKSTIISLTLLFSLLTTFVGIKFLGVSGAAWATLASIILHRLLMAVAVKKRLGIFVFQNR